MEDFLRDKLKDAEHDYRNDWPDFEEKLERAIFFYRLKVGALVSAVLILISLGIFGTSAFVGTGKPAASAQPDSVKSAPAKVSAPRAEALSVNIPLENAVVLRETDFRKSRGSKPDKKQAAIWEMLPPGVKEAGKKPVQFAYDAKTPAVKDSRNALAQNTAKEAKEASGAGEKAEGSAAVSERNTAVDLSRKGTGMGKAPGAEAGKHMGALEIGPIHGSLDNLSASLNINTSVLDETMKRGEATELHIRPPIMPVSLEKPGPYVSPMQEKNPWSFALSVYPNFTFRKFKVDKNKLNYIHRDFIDATIASERGGFSLNVGLRISRRIGPITYLNSGVEYINYKTRNEYDFTNFREAAINEETKEIMHYTLKSDPEQVTFVDDNAFHYLNIPLSISHKPWAHDHIRLNIEAGVSFMYFLTARGTSLDYRTLEVVDISGRDYRKAIGAFHMKVGANYHISPQFNFGLEPTLMYFTNTIYTEEYPFQVIPYSVGVNLKLQMKLN